jgi:hypothetical protein
MTHQMFGLHQPSLVAVGIAIEFWGRLGDATHQDNVRPSSIRYYAGPFGGYSAPG